MIKRIISCIVSTVIVLGATIAYDRTPACRIAVMEQVPTQLASVLPRAASYELELRTQNEALTAKNAELLERLGEMTLDTDKIRAQLDQIESGFSLQATEIEAQNARAAQLAAENDRLTSENAKLSAKCGEYDATREKIAEMELSAYRRAKQIEEDAKVELQKLRRKSMETIEQVRRQLDATKENYRTVLASRRPSGS